MTAEDRLAWQNVKAWSDVRLAYADTGREWLDGGLSKTRYGSADSSGWDGEIADLSLVWTPTLSANLTGHLHLQAGPDQSVDVGLVEGFLRYRSLPRAGWRLSAKAGRFFPPISFEHDGPGWGLTRTLTPSAINSWIGEEVAVVGTEVRAAKRFADHLIDFRASAFGYNDTAGTLLGYRGWALHDIKSALHGKFAIPDTVPNRPMLSGQATVTEPYRELDETLGYYGAARWRYSDMSTVALTYYDNRADPEVLQNGQYGWNTQFWSLGAHHHVTESLELIAQAMWGETRMGPPVWPNGTQVSENEFASAFLLASWHLPKSQILSGRIDTFRVLDLTHWQDFTNEDGWSLTTAWRRKLSPRVELGAELLYIEHDREIDAAAGDRQNGLQAQALWRLNF